MKRSTFVATLFAVAAGLAGLFGAITATAPARANTAASQCGCGVCACQYCNGETCECPACECVACGCVS